MNTKFKNMTFQTVLLCQSECVRDTEVIILYSGAKIDNAIIRKVSRKTGNKRIEMCEKKILC